MHNVDFKKWIALAAEKERMFFPSLMPRELKELYLTMTMLNFGLAVGMLFEPIYLYTIGFSLSDIMLYFFALYTLYFFIMPLGGKFVKGRGFEHGIMVGSVFLIAYFILLYNIPQSPFFLVGAIVASALQKTFFWPGYHADFAYFSQAEERGREMSLISILDMLSFVLGPLVGGLLIASFGFAGLFAAMCVIILLSNIPIMTTRERFMPSTMMYAEVYNAITDKKNRRTTLGYVGFGEELIVLTVWPIFVFLAFDNFVETGIAITVTTLITSFAVLYVGRLTDKKNYETVLRRATLFVVMSWIIRLVTSGVGGVMFADFFSRTTKYLFNLPFYSALYKRARSTSVVGTVLFFEMGLVIGKIVVAGVLAVLFYYFPEAWQAAFVLAALFSLLYFLLCRVEKAPEVET